MISFCSVRQIKTFCPVCARMLPTGLRKQTRRGAGDVWECETHWRSSDATSCQTVPHWRGLCMAFSDLLAKRSCFYQWHKKKMALLLLLLLLLFLWIIAVSEGFESGFYVLFFSSADDDGITWSLNVLFHLFVKKTMWCSKLVSGLFIRLLSLGVNSSLNSAASSFCRKTEVKWWKEASSLQALNLNALLLLLLQLVFWGYSYCNLPRWQAWAFAENLQCWRNKKRKIQKCHGTLRTVIRWQQVLNELLESRLWTESQLGISFPAQGAAWPKI